MQHHGPVRVLIVDDSALIRSTLSRVLGNEPDLEVVAAAKDALEAREWIIQQRPQVIILDAVMPHVSGFAFLRKLMVHYPVPVIVCVDAGRNAEHMAQKALELGAVATITKPAGRAAVTRMAGEVAGMVRAAAGAGVIPPPLRARAVPKPISFRGAGLNPGRYVVAIGASTGGTDAVRTLLVNTPRDFPPIIIVQHMPEGFTRSFADRLNELCALQVSEAVHGDILTPGHAFLARGGVQMVVAASGRKRWLMYGDSTPVNRHCPSVDVLFDSLVQPVGTEAIGVLLTGMGADGAEGLFRLREAGAITVGQNEESCVVYGMPKVAFDIGAVQRQAAPQDIPRTIVQAVRKRDGAAVAAAQ